jgi:hypothetical protein
MTEDDETPEERLGPGSHPPDEGRYVFDVNGRPIHARAGWVGDPFAGGLRTGNDPIIAALIRDAMANASIRPATTALIPWALTTVAATTPDALGLYGPARYSGPGPTSLIGNLAHRTRGDAFAAELIVAACLAQAHWPDTAGSMTLGAGLFGRLDFGVKHLAGRGRRTVESDILISHGGVRRGVDVKFSRTGVYGHVIVPSVQHGIREAIEKQELSSFHWVTPGRFAPRVKRAAEAVAGLHLHEGLWPSAQSIACIDTIEGQALDVRAIIRDWQQDVTHDLLDLGRQLFDEAWTAYERVWGDSDDLVETTTRDGFTYLYDARVADPPLPPPRLVAAFGLAHDRPPPRQPSFMRGFPLPSAPIPIDRGHVIARTSGGAEGIGMNLIPQNRAPNRWMGREGRRWRDMERLTARNPGALVWRRMVYGSADDIPGTIETLVAIDAETTVVDVFANRSCIHSAEGEI